MPGHSHVQTRSKTRAMTEEEKQEQADRFRRQEEALERRLRGEKAETTSEAGTAAETATAADSTVGTSAGGKLPEEDTAGDSVLEASASELDKAMVVHGFSHLTASDAEVEPEHPKTGPALKDVTSSSLGDTDISREDISRDELSISPYVPSTDDDDDDEFSTSVTSSTDDRSPPAAKKLKKFHASKKEKGEKSKPPPRKVRVTEPADQITVTSSALDIKHAKEIGKQMNEAQKKALKLKGSDDMEGDDIPRDLPVSGLDMAKEAGPLSSSNVTTFFTALVAGSQGLLEQTKLAAEFTSKAKKNLEEAEHAKDKASFVLGTWKKALHGHVVSQDTENAAANLANRKLLKKWGLPFDSDEAVDAFYKDPDREDLLKEHLLKLEPGTNMKSRKKYPKKLLQELMTVKYQATHKWPSNKAGTNPEIHPDVITLIKDVAETKYSERGIHFEQSRWEKGMRERIRNQMNRYERTHPDVKEARRDKARRNTYAKRRNVSVPLHGQSEEERQAEEQEIEETAEGNEPRETLRADSSGDGSELHLELTESDFEGDKGDVKAKEKVARKKVDKEAQGKKCSKVDATKATKAPKAQEPQDDDVLMEDVFESEEDIKARLAKSGMFEIHGFYGMYYWDKNRIVQVRTLSKQELDWIRQEKGYYTGEKMPEKLHIDFLNKWLVLTPEHTSEEDYSSDSDTTTSDED